MGRNVIPSQRLMENLSTILKPSLLEKKLNAKGCFLNFSLLSHSLTHSIKAFLSIELSILLYFVPFSSSIRQQYGKDKLL